MKRKIRQERQEFSSKWAFILAAASSAIGLGNIWRFPFVVHDNGGGAFIIPYIIAIVTMGIPLMVLEFVYGSKFRGTTPLAMARVGKKFEFFGWVPTIIAGLIIFYYGVILVWAMHYTVFAFTKEWGDATSTFFTQEFLRVSDSPLNLRAINWTVVLGLLVLWVPSYFVMSAGIKKGLEKVNKVLLPIMFVAIVLFMIRGVTLPGAALGLNSLFTPDFSAMLDPNVWMAAYGQAMFALSLCMGILITYASYLKKGTEIVNTSFITASLDMLFALLSTVAIFGIVGYMAHAGGIAVDEVGGGMGLVFMTLPLALNYMGGFGYFLGVTFFGSLVLLGWTSFLSLMEAFIAPFIEKFGWGRKKTYFYLCFFGFAASLIYATDSAQLVLGLVDYTVNNYGLPLVGVVQAVIAAWLTKNLPAFKDYTNTHTNTLPYFKVGAFWIICVKYIIPVTVGANLLMAAWAAIEGRAPGVVAARTLDELVVFVGGTVLIIVLGSWALTKVPWRTGVDSPM